MSTAVPYGECEFVGVSGRAGWSTRTEVKQLSQRRVHPRGLGGSAAHAYKCVRLATGQGDVLLLSFDRDLKNPMRKGVAEASRTASVVIPTVIAEAFPEFEAWVIAGHQPADAHERDLHEQAVEMLKESGFAFDPLEKPHLLTSDVTGDPRDAKQVLRLLLGVSGQPAEAPEVLKCLDAEIEVLRSRGKQTGIVEFLDEISSVLLPLLRR